MDLVYDSSAGEVGAVKGEVVRSGERRLRFDSQPSGVTAQVAVVLGPPGQDLGQTMTIRVLPPHSVAVEVRWAGDSVSFVTSGEGCAMTTVRPQGLLCLILRSDDPDVRPLQTSWVRA